MIISLCCGYEMSLDVHSPGVTLVIRMPGLDTVEETRVALTTANIRELITELQAAEAKMIWLASLNQGINAFEDVLLGEILKKASAMYQTSQDYETCKALVSEVASKLRIA